MKHTLTLAAWNFRLARRSLLALWGIFAAQQLVLVVVRICWQGAAGMGLASHYYVTMQIFAYLGFYLLTGLAAGLATHNSRRARSGYTWATLPGTPGQKFGAKAITIAAAEVVFTAWQFVWYIVEFYPVTALEVHLARKLYGAALPPANLYEQVVANNLFSRLLPRRPLQLVILLGILALSALLLAVGITASSIGLNSTLEAAADEEAPFDLTVQNQSADSAGPECHRQKPRLRSTGLSAGLPELCFCLCYCLPVQLLQ